ncbi:MAG: LLM class flavin-dependent oxidoreductase [Chloroflexi bacterium]|nr:LLM class flavin-dependent oxidoreductase [Chloroflexota bacterium]
MSESHSKPALGVIFHPRFPPETLAEYARKAEAAGFDELWLWDDCFLPGAFTSAAVALAATERLRVGIGLIPVPAYNPLFAAMEITTLARAFPGRFLPGFGHGVGAWMAQIGAAPRSPLKALEETLLAMRALLNGEPLSLRGSWVNLDQVQMQLTPERVPPLYVGGIREKTLRLAGRLGDGAILTGMSSPAYVRWAREQICAGAAEGGREYPRVTVYVDTKVGRDRAAARAAARRALAERLPWESGLLQGLGIAEEVEAFHRAGHNTDEAARRMPDAWVDALCAAGEPDEVAGAVQNWFAAGANSVVLQPLNGDPACLEEYIRFLSPLWRLVG